MKIERLNITNFRNLSSLCIEPSPNFNVIFGNNGTGKTSLLEAISYIGLGRSFRQSRFQSLIKESEPFFAINARILIDDSSYIDEVGLCRFRERNKPLQIKINNQSSNRISDIVSKLSVQVIHPQCFELILGGPEYRRSFIDWGLFYSEAGYIDLWNKYQKILVQRNSLLKQKASYDYIEFWDNILSETGEIISKKREDYLNKLLPFLQKNLLNFLPNFSFDFVYQKGWENGSNLGSMLALNIEKDRLLGYTFYGCHRADLKIKCNQFAASEMLSRGQLKLLVCAMSLAQGQLLKSLSSKSCIYLIDDLSSELDLTSRQLLLEHLVSGDNQVFLTNISKDIELPQSSSTSFLDIAASIKDYIS